MTTKYLSLMTTPAVREAQRHYYAASRPIPESAEPVSLTEEEMDFIRERDSFYIATVTETGWPYMQHRGGRAGFLKVLNPRLLAFADYKGNRQLLTTGNLAANDRVALFLMDYPTRNRLKIMGHARVEDARHHPELLAQLVDPEQQSKVERLIMIDVVAYDWNCSQYITPRYTTEQVETLVRPLQQRVAALTEQVRELQAKLSPQVESAGPKDLAHPCQ